MVVTKTIFPGVAGPGGTPNVRYYWGDPIGSGNYGEIAELRRVPDGCLFAGKVIDLDKRQDKEIARLQTEVSCIRTCARHFGCVDFIEEALHERRLLIVMEYCDAGTLRFQLDIRKQFHDENEIRLVLLQLTLALNHLHSERILHRDLKPENVLLLTNGLVKIGDFGLSKELDISTSTSLGGKTACGTPSYMAPEVWKGNRYGIYADIWALGVTLYEMMTGHLPFQANSLFDMRKAVTKGVFPPLDSTKYSADLIDIVHRSLMTEPKERRDTVELLDLPYLQDSLGLFVQAVSSLHGVIDDLMLAKVKIGVAYVRARVEGDQPLPLPMPTKQQVFTQGIIREGAVGKRKKGGRTDSRYLRLTPTHLQIGKSSNEPSWAELPLCNLEKAMVLLDAEGKPTPVFSICRPQDALHFEVSSVDESSSWVDALAGAINAQARDPNYV